MISGSALINNDKQELVDRRALELASVNLFTANSFGSYHMLYLKAHEKSWQTFREIPKINGDRIRVNSRVNKKEKYPQKILCYSVVVLGFFFEKRGHQHFLADTKIFVLENKSYIPLCFYRLDSSAILYFLCYITLFPGGNELVWWDHSRNATREMGNDL